MNRLDLANSLAAGLAVVLGTTLGVGDRPAAAVHARETTSARSTARVAGRGMLTDATGAEVPLTAYARIVSGSIVADSILLELCPPERIAALTDRIHDSPRYRERAAGIATLASTTAIEPVLALRPDLLVVSHFANPQVLVRLRESGIQVFDLGPMHGLESMRDDIVALGALCGTPERGQELADRLHGRMRSLAERVLPQARPRGLYLAVYGTKLFGGTRRTSYHDVLEAAGVTDAAAVRWEGWPELGAEAVLALDPDLIVTKRGMAAVICRAPGFDLARACRYDRVIEIEGSLIDDPGLAMADAAEALFEKVHGDRR